MVIPKVIAGPRSFPSRPLRSPSAPTTSSAAIAGRSVYLAHLGAGSRRAMRDALEAIARVATAGAADADALPWQALRYQHTAAIRVELAERYAPATANKMLSALKGVLREAWRLELLDGHADRRAVDLRARPRRWPAPRPRARRRRATRALRHLRRRSRRAPRRARRGDRSRALWRRPATLRGRRA